MNKQAFLLNGQVAPVFLGTLKTKNSKREGRFHDKITFLPDNKVQNSIAIVPLPDKAQSESMYTLKLCEDVLDWCFDTSSLISGHNCLQK